MTITAQAAVLSFAPQPAKVGSGAFTIGDYTWRRHKAMRIQMGTIQGDEVFPLEVGGVPVPTGAYKRAQYFAGTAEFIPRLENVFGWLMHATMGNVSTTANQPVSTMHTHIFRFNPSNSFDIPWMAMRLLTPGAVTADNFGEVGIDGKITALQFQIPGSGKVTAGIQYVARRAEYVENPSWTYSNTFEQHESTPDSGRGSARILGTAYPLVGAEVMFQNGLTTPQEEMVLGSFNPDDFVARSRSMTVRFAYKYANPDLYQNILTGSGSGTTWSSLPKTYESTGGNYALDLYFQSPGISVGSTPYGLRFRANKCVIAREGPPQLAGGNMIVENYTATVLEPASGDYAQIVLENAVANYTWPT